MTDTKKIIIISVAGLVLSILLLAAIIVSISDSNTGSEIGLFRPDETAVPSEETDQGRQQEYDQRTELPKSIEKSLTNTVIHYLSAGDFDGLDAKLALMAVQYKETEDDAIAIMDEIDGYRADIAYTKSIFNLDNKPIKNWQFKNSELLAAAIAYTPISLKYQAFISYESAVMAPALDNISLCQAEKKPDELREILNNINMTRSQGHEYQMAAVYTMRLFGYECEFIAVSDIISMSWQPYSLTVLNDHHFPINVSLCYDLLDASPTTNLDAVLAFPAAE